MNLDHTRVSELLTAFVRDELGADQAADVRAHLDECETCRAEFNGLRVLASLPDERLEPSERVALRDAVRARVEKKSWSLRLAPALGALGLVAIVVVGAAAILGDGVVGGDGDSSDVAAEAQGGGDRAATDQAGEAAPQRAARPGLETDSQTATGNSLDAGGPVAKRARPEALFSTVPSYADAGPLRPDLLSARDTGTLADAPRRRLGPLLALAPHDGWAEQMTTCSDAVASFLPADAHAAYAAVYPADGLLVMGFLWSEDGAQRYAFWGWPAGSCATITPIYASGTL